MTKRLIGLVAAFTFLIALSLLMACDKRAMSSSLTTPFVYGQDELTEFLRKSGIEVEVISDVRRNASGTELFVYLFNDSSNHNSVIKINTNGLTQMTAPGFGAVPSSDGGFLVWPREDGICFQNGQIIALPRFGFYEVDPSGKYFIIGDKPHKAWLCRLTSPAEKMMIADDFLPGGVFVSKDKIYVTGHSYSRNSAGRTKPLTTCLVLKDEAGSFKIVDRLSFDWASGVVEVDPSAERLLLWDKALISHSVYSYDLSTKQRHKVGTVKGFQFFLVTDLLKTSRINKGKHMD